MTTLQESRSLRLAFANGDIERFPEIPRYNTPKNDRK